MAMVMSIAGVATAGRALASSDAAWAQFNTRVTKACIAASGMRGARVSSIVGFDDRVGMVAMLVNGQGRKPAMLCLYNKRTRTAYVDEASGWRAPPARAGR
ncbi:hypothetical protein F1C10_10830 [Sphingomonas sp. NBWT7]|nr:hypothetical protein F1C10_10830 [Sphingomonas sp. NBWT7]